MWSFHWKLVTYYRPPLRCFCLWMGGWILWSPEKPSSCLWFHWSPSLHIVLFFILPKTLLSLNILFFSLWPPNSSLLEFFVNISIFSGFKSVHWILLDSIIIFSLSAVKGHYPSTPFLFPVFISSYFVEHIVIY